MQRVQLNRRSALASAGLTLLLFAYLAAVAEGAVKVTVKPLAIAEYQAEAAGPQHDVRINGDSADDKISVSLEGRFLKVNGLDPAGAPVNFGSVAVLIVDGGPGSDSINLRGMRGFRDFVAEGLDVAGNFVVRGNLGNDHILAPGVTAEDVEANGGLRVVLTQLLGGKGKDRIVGSHDADDISGGPGADRIYGLDGSDLLKGGPGADLIRGGDNPPGSSTSLMEAPGMTGSLVDPATTRCTVKWVLTSSLADPAGISCTKIRHRVVGFQSASTNHLATATRSSTSET